MTPPFEIIDAKKDVPLFIFGDHASRHIPAEYDDLGLSDLELTRHIAWDIGTETMIRHLCDHFGCVGQLAAVSRLVVDLNRDINAESVIPKDSDGTVIPGNQSLSPQQRQTRIERFYTPYHTQLARAMDARNDDPFVISVHSFTPHPRMGEKRETDIGILVKHDMESAQMFEHNFKSLDHPLKLGRPDDPFKIGMNKPYSAHDLNHTVDAHIVPHGYRHLAIEVRQDHVDTNAKAIAMAELLAACIAPMIGRGKLSAA